MSAVPTQSIGWQSVSLPETKVFDSLVIVKLDSVSSTQQTCETLILGTPLPSPSGWNDDDGGDDNDEHDIDYDDDHDDDNNDNDVRVR